MDRNRQPPGQPTGGQYAEQHKHSADLALAGYGAPIELSDGGDYTFIPGDEVIDHIDVLREGETYRAEANTKPVPAGYLLDAEDLDADDLEQIMSGPRWRAMERFLADRYRHTEVLDGGDGDDLVFNIAADFDHPPTEEQVTGAVWPTAAQIANETDRGTFGVPFVGTELTAHLDAQAFCDLYPLEADGRRWPREPVGQRQAHADAEWSRQTGLPVGDDTAQALAKELAERTGQDCYRSLHLRGHAERQALAAAAAAPDADPYAPVLDLWARSQQSTSALLAAARHTGSG